LTDEDIDDRERRCAVGEVEGSLSGVAEEAAEAADAADAVDRLVAMADEAGALS